MSSRMCLLLGSAALMMSGTNVVPALASEHQFTESLNRAQLVYRVHRGMPHQRIVWVRRWVWDNFWGDYHIVWVPRVTEYRTASYSPRTSHRTHKMMVAYSASKSADANGDSEAKPDKDTETASVNPKPRPQPTANADNDIKLASSGSHAKPSKAAAKPAPKADNDTKLASGDGDAKPSQAAAKPAPKPNNDTKMASLDLRNTPPDEAEKPAAKVRVDLTKPVTPAEIRSAVPLGNVNDPKQTLASTPIKSVWGDTLGKVRGVDVSGGSVKSVDAQMGGKDVVKIDPARLKYVKSRGLLITTLSKEDAAKLPKADNS
jgi:hypothetical protein